MSCTISACVSPIRPNQNQIRWPSLSATRSMITWKKLAGLRVFPNPFLQLIDGDSRLIRTYEVHWRAEDDGEIARGRMPGIHQGGHRKGRSHARADFDRGRWA